MPASLRDCGDLRVRPFGTVETYGCVPSGLWRPTGASLRDCGDLRVRPFGTVETYGCVPSGLWRPTGASLRDCGAYACASLRDCGAYACASLRDCGALHVRPFGHTRQGDPQLPAKRVNPRQGGQKVAVGEAHGLRFGRDGHPGRGARNDGSRKRSGVLPSHGKRAFAST